MTDEEVYRLAYIVAGAVSAVFMEKLPDLVMPIEEVTQAVETSIQEEKNNV